MGYINRPKLNPKDNTIITKEIKHNYSREYVIKLLRSQADFIDDLYRPYHRNNTLGFDSCDKFIEQNL